MTYSSCICWFLAPKWHSESIGLIGINNDILVNDQFFRDVWIYQPSRILSACVAFMALIEGSVPSAVDSLSLLWRLASGQVETGT